MKSIKILVLLFGLGLSFFACNSKVDHTKNIELVKAYVNAVKTMDFEAMNTYLDDSYLGMGPSFGDSINKSQAVENWKDNIEHLYQKIEYTRSKFAPVTISDGDGKGDWVANWAELHITFKDGSQITIWSNTNYRIQNDKIVQSITFYNEADALRQLGYGFVPME